MELKNQFSKAFKIKVIEEVLSGEISKEQARKKYSIKGKSAILNWMRKFEYAIDKPSIKHIIPMKCSEDLSEEQLKKRVKELERALEDAQIKAEIYSRAIDIAEKTFKIKIRKKPSSNQSKK